MSLRFRRKAEIAFLLGLALLLFLSPAGLQGRTLSRLQAQNPSRSSHPVHRAVQPDFNATRAMQYVREVVKIGSRPPGSEGHKKLETYLRAHLRGDIVEEDSFAAPTPVGTFQIRNFIAKYPGSRPGVIVIASHYDTNYPLKNYVGANDGGSSTGLLLELANQLRGRKLEGYSVWLVWLDGEEAFKEWSSTDSLYGSRHLVEKWKTEGTLKSIKYFLLADMIGDADLNIDRDDYSDPQLEQTVYRAAEKLGFQSHFFHRTIAIEDDHIPFARAGIKVADLIDYDYGYGNVFHHTPEDTLDKLSVNSLDIVGRVLLQTCKLLNAD